MVKNETKIIIDLLELEPVVVQLKNLYLDPNNPRFLTDFKEPVPDSRIKEEKVQNNLLTKLIEEIGIEDITESIARYGFLTIDRVIIKPISEVDFVVLEGNRRIASLKVLKEQHERGELSLNIKIKDTLDKIEILVYRGDKKDIAWTIQGLRHLTGIKGWPRLQQAKFITENFYEEKSMGFREVARLLNMKSTDVGTLIRSYYGYSQGLSDDEYGDLLTSDKFSMFQEAVFRKQSLKDWLGWNDTTNQFRNIDNFKKFLRWITPDENGVVKLTALEARDIMSKLVLDENISVLEKFENDEITIHQARTEMDKKETKEEVEKESIDVRSVLHEIDRLYKRLSTLPMPQIISNPEAKDKLKKLFKQIITVVDTYESMLS